MVILAWRITILGFNDKKSGEDKQHECYIVSNKQQEKKNVDIYGHTLDR